MPMVRPLLLLTLSALVLLPQVAAAQVAGAHDSVSRASADEASDLNVWVRMGLFAPVTSFPAHSGYTDGSVKLASALSLGAVAEWTVRPSWTAVIGVDGAVARPVPTARGADCQYLRGYRLPCAGGDWPSGIVLHGHAGLVRELGAVRVGLGVGPRILRIEGWDCQLISTNILCGVAGSIHRQHSVMVVGTGLVGVQRTLNGRSFRLDLLNGVTQHRGSLQYELMLTAGIGVFR
jgi:hypothetical protein